jgi:hypothetical protein
MMQQYAGPLNPGDMAIRANELSPGISALLMKQMRNSAGSGIYQLPVAKQSNPDFYNSALDNVQNNIRTAARTVNSMAPEGERLAYINPQEEGILRLLGGSGEPEPVTGIPSFAPPGTGSTRTNPGFSGSYSRSPSSGGGGGGNKSSAFSGNVQNKSDQQKMLAEIDKAIETSKPKVTYGGGATGPANTQFQQTAEGLAAAIKEATGPAYADQAKGAITSFIGAAGAGEAGMYDPVKAAQALVDLSKSGTPEQQALAKQENKALVDALKYSLGSYDYGGKTLFGMGDGYYLGDDTKNILRAAETYGQLPRDKTFFEKAGDVLSGVGITGLLSKLFGSGKKLEDMTVEELKEFYDKQDAMRAAEEMRRRDRGGDGGQAQAPAVIPEEEEEEEEEDILDFFDYYRRFKQPMSYEDIIKRAYKGSSGPLLESFQEAMEREQE